MPEWPRIREGLAPWETLQDLQDFDRAANRLAGDCWDLAGVEVEVERSAPTDPVTLRLYVTAKGEQVIIAHAYDAATIDTARKLLAQLFGHEL